MMSVLWPGKHQNIPSLTPHPELWRRRHQAGFWLSVAGLLQHLRCGDVPLGRGKESSLDTAVGDSWLGAALGPP